MCYNPPEFRDQIRDTLYFMGIPYSYEKIKEKTRHVYSFELDNYSILIYGPRFTKLNKKTYKSIPELQNAIIDAHRHLI